MAILMLILITQGITTLWDGFTYVTQKREPFEPGLQEVLEPITEEQKGYLTVTWASRFALLDSQMFHVIYPLVNVYTTMEHHHFLWVNPL